MLVVTINAFITSISESFHWNGLQVRVNLQDARRQDQFNRGLSLMVCLGDYYGGKFKVSHGPATCLKNRYCFFDGKKYHSTEYFHPRWQADGEGYPGGRVSIEAFSWDIAAEGLEPEDPYSHKRLATGLARRTAGSERLSG